MADLIRDVNASNEAVEDQCLRARQATDVATRSVQTAELAMTTAVGAKVAHRTIQAEHPRRRASLPRQVFFALVTVALDGLACYFAAQALDGSQDATLVWAGLFLAVLAGGEVALDFYRDRHQGAWRLLCVLLAAFVTALGVLRFSYLATVGTGGLVPAVAGACLFTAATAALPVPRLPRPAGGRDAAGLAGAPVGARGAAVRAGGPGGGGPGRGRTGPPDRRLPRPGQAAGPEDLPGRAAAGHGDGGAGAPARKGTGVKTAGRAAHVRLVAVAAALVLTVSGCKLMTPTVQPAIQQVSLPRARPSLLVVLTDGGSPSTLAALRALITATVRPGERILILDDRSGAVLASSTAPAAPSVSVAGSPAPLRAGATGFQKSRFQRAIREYRARLRNARATLQRRQNHRLTAWAGTLVARTDAQLLRQNAGGGGIRAALGTAAADMSSLSQAGVTYGAHKVIVILGMDDTTAHSMPGIGTGLQGATAVIGGFPGNSNDETAWQAALLQAGASRAVLLTPATADQLVTVVRQGLDGAIPDTLTNVLFGLGQSGLRPAALPQLGHLLRLLISTYPQSTASINGYTDDLPVPGGNLELSQRRAQAVEAWLVAHGVAASRLQAVG